MSVLMLAFYLLVPALLIYACQQFKLLDKLGAVVIAFGLGIVLALLGLLPNDTDTLNLKKTVSEVSVALALPLLVFSMDVRAALAFAGNTMKAFALAVLSVAIISAIAAIIFSPYLPDIYQVAGMSAASYTGGTPNMAAIKTALNVDDDLFTAMLTYDIALSAMYMLLLMIVAKPIFRHVLPRFNRQQQAANTDAFNHLADDSANLYRPLAQRSLLGKTGAALLLSALVVGLSVGISKLIPGSMSSAVAIISITSLGVAASFIPVIRNLPTSYPLGMYCILTFCFTTGSMVSSSLLTNLNWPLFLYIGCIIFGAFFIHFLLCRLFKFDVDTFLVTSAATIMSVPFMPVIAGAIRNRALIVPGLAAAILGYILGNYMGLLVAWGSHSLLG